MMDDAEFETKNSRRIELITKEHSGFSEEENRRPFTEPGWKEECERRHAANLSDDEREELAQLETEVEQYMDAKFPPRDHSADLEEIRQIEQELKQIEDGLGG